MMERAETFVKLIATGMNYVLPPEVNVSVKVVISVMEMVCVLTRPDVSHV
jgi:hypothetical protein